MAAVADLERILERVFERTTARLFRSSIQVVQVERRVERAMERARGADGTRTGVPARYSVRLHPADLADVAGRSGGAEALAARLAGTALAFAKGHGYRLAGRPEVWLIADPVVERGQVVVEAAAGGTLSPANRFAGDDAASVPEQAATGLPVAVRPTAEPPVHVPPVHLSPVQAPPPEAPVPGIRGDGTQTHVFRRPVPPAASAVLRVCAADGRERTIDVGGTPVTIGRAGDNVLVLGDSRVSRHHGRLQTRRGALLYVDLGSTNGSRVNGIRVDEIVLGAGDRLQVGDTVLVVETLPG
jgi:hypothetical protein